MKKIILFIVVIFAFSLVSNAQTPPKTADEILNSAIAQAKQEHKKVLVMFHASWCPWCHKFDHAMDDPSCKNVFDKNFVIAKLVIWERGDKAALNNPDAEKMFDKYGGKAQGIPYWLIFDENGKFLTDSKFKKPGEKENMTNSGYPSTETEIQIFIDKLKKYTNITDDEAKAVHDSFLKYAS